jgi:hypothetical protein
VSTTADGSDISEEREQEQPWSEAKVGIEALASGESGEAPFHPPQRERNARKSHLLQDRALQRIAALRFITTTKGQFPQTQT